ncbi:type IV toxin-antitoxin system AbiEi family antitoxin domain-containing protein [Nocardioides pacificus]
MSLATWLGQPLLDESFPLPLDTPFSTSMALQQGITRATLSKLVESRLLHRPVRGTYLAAQAGDSVALRAAALALIAPEDAVICGRHAGWLHGAEMLLAPNEHLGLQTICMFRPSGHGRLRSKLADSGERNLAREDVMELHGLRVTTPVRTALDLGRLEHRDRALAGLDAMARLGGFSVETLVREVERFRGMRGVVQLRELVLIVDPLAESPGESVTRLRWIDAGLPTPRLQIEVLRNGVVIARLDIGNEPLRLAVEYAGEEWHSTPLQRSHDQARRAELDRDFGWEIVPVRAANVFGRHRDCEELMLQGVRRARERLARRAA